MRTECKECICSGCKKRHSNMQCGKCNDCSIGENGEDTFQDERYCDEVEKEK